MKLVLNKIASILACLSLIGCSVSTSVSTPTLAPTPTKERPTLTPTTKPEISETFKEQLMRFLEEATTLNAMTEVGVSYLNYQQQLGKAAGAYQLASVSWPPNFAPKARNSLDKAFEGWELALELWSLKVQGVKYYGIPTEPDFYGYQRFVTYAGEVLYFGVRSPTYQIPQFQGKKYVLVADENISVLLTLASDYFEVGRTAILAEMP